jgi:DNA-binding response OmpR family regulator
MTKILVAEDEKNLRRLYEQELREEGYAVVVAGDGHEAIHLFRKERPDLVVLDILMPGMDGLELMGHMLSEQNEVPVILNTAYPTYQDNFLSWSADAYVIKSADLKELKREIRRLVEERELGEAAPGEQGAEAGA